MADKIERWYNTGAWTKDMVKEALEAHIITEDDYNRIIGE